MNNKTTTKYVIQRNDKFLKFNPTGEVEHSDPLSATMYSTPGKANRRLSQEEFEDCQLIAIDVSWEYSVPEEPEDIKAEAEMEAQTGNES